jgi:hypothetical protein
MAHFAASRLAYEGDYAPNGKRHGHGKYQFDDDSSYEGDWINDHQHGMGVHIFANGERYEGQYVNGLMHGKGTWYKIDGSSFTGIWAEGFKTLLLSINGERFPCCHADWSSDKNRFSDTLLVRTVPALADSELINAADLAGNVAVVQRGVVAFTQKVQRAVVAGAVGVIVVNNDPTSVESLYDMADPDHQSPAGGFAIPVLAVSYATGSVIAVGSTCTLECSDAAAAHDVLETEVDETEVTLSDLHHLAGETGRKILRRHTAPVT